MPEFLQSNFNGEWSPLMLGRVELSRYATSLRTMENFAPTISGGARKRPGTEYLGEVQDSSKKTRLESFTFSNDQSYLLEFGHNVLRFWRNGVLLSDTETTPYTEDEVFSLRMTSTNDIVYIASPNHPSYKLTRTSDTTFDFALLEFENQPFEDENLTDVTIAASAHTGTGITLTSSSDLFTDEMDDGDGSTFKISHYISRSVSESSINETNQNITYFSPATSYQIGDKISVQISGTYFYYTCHTAYVGGTSTQQNPVDLLDYFSPGIVAQILGATSSEMKFYIEGEWSFRTEGNWDGEWGIQESEDGQLGNWVTRFSMASDSGSDNYVREGDESDNPIWLRVVLFSIGSGSNHRVTWTTSDVEKSGEVTITSYISPTQVTADVSTTRPLYSTAATKHWAENEWNQRKGFPSQVFFKNNRLCFAATKSDNQAIWGSEVDKWDNFKRGVQEDSKPFKDVLRTGNQDPIQWVSEQSKTLLGLSSQIRNLTGEDGSSILAPGKNRSARQAGRGAADLEPVEVDDFTFYVQLGGRIIRGLTNDYERGVYAAADMTREAEHVTRGGVKQMAFQLNRVSTLYAVTGDGIAACLVFDPEVEKMGWYRLKTQGGAIESIAILPATGEEDEVYFVVKRTIEGDTKRYIERLKNDQIRVQDDGIQDDMFYVDCGTTITGTNITTVTGLNHLSGKKIQVLGDGDYLGKFDVIENSITIPASNKVTYGLPIEAKLWQMPLEGITASGTTSGDKKRVKEITIDVVNSLGLQTKDSPDDTKEPNELTPRQADAPLGSSPELYSGKLEIRNTLPRSFDGNVFYQSNIPFGVFIRNIITKWEKTS